MWNRMHSLIMHLHEPEHVARFQRLFGVLPLSENSSIPTLKVDEKSRTTNRLKSRILNGLHDQNKVTYDTNVLDECIEEMKHSTTDPVDGKKDPSSEIDYRITSWFWYYFFELGAALGNEIFYILFFPTWIWNVDVAVARKVSILWAFFMYLGQATKDILAIPRPSSPPVLHIEKRYIQEYGFPSTHAMFAAGIPLSLVLLSYKRYEFNITIALICATVICLWVCLSRIYLGMHTFLDIIAGALYALFLVSLMLPFVDIIDDFQLNFILSPIINFMLGILLIKCYPSLKQWSTARSDTTIILSSTFGLSSASTIMHHMGLLERPLTPPVYSIIAPDFGLCVLRTIIGLLLIYVTRHVIKTVVLRVTCSIYGLDWKNSEIKRLAQVEMPYYYLTYYAIGFNVAFLCPLAFRFLKINRDYSYTEL